MVTGFFTMVFASLDYSPLLGLTAFDKKQVLYLGGISMVKGVFTELARRRNMMSQPPTTEG
jgi:hypothetical protein